MKINQKKRHTSCAGNPLLAIWTTIFLYGKNLSPVSKSNSQLKL
jgi:hypothetical protein